jgi:DNA-binding response OmpR family regulator
VELQKAGKRRQEGAAESQIILRLVGGESATRALRLLKAHQAPTSNGRPIVVALVLPSEATASAIPMVPDTARPREERFGDVIVDFGARVVIRAGAPVELTPRQFDLLAALVRSDGQALNRRELIQHAWPDADGSGARTVDTHIWHLRHRLEVDPTTPKHIVTVKKIGYRFQK